MIYCKNEGYLRSYSYLDIDGNLDDVDAHAHHVSTGSAVVPGPVQKTGRVAWEKQVNNNS